MRWNVDVSRYRRSVFGSQTWSREEPYSIKSTQVRSWLPSYVDYLYYLQPVVLLRLPHGVYGFEFAYGEGESTDKDISSTYGHYFLNHLSTYPDRGTAETVWCGEPLHGNRHAIYDTYLVMQPEDVSLKTFEIMPFLIVRGNSISATSCPDKTLGRTRYTPLLTDRSAWIQRFRIRHGSKLFSGSPLASWNRISVPWPSWT